MGPSLQISHTTRRQRQKLSRRRCSPSSGTAGKRFSSERARALRGVGGRRREDLSCFIIELCDGNDGEARQGSCSVVCGLGSLSSSGRVAAIVSPASILPWSLAASTGAFSTAPGRCRYLVDSLYQRAACCTAVRGAVHDLRSGHRVWAFLMDVPRIAMLLRCCLQATAAAASALAVGM